MLTASLFLLIDYTAAKPLFRSKAPGSVAASSDVSNLWMLWWYILARSGLTVPHLLYTDECSLKLRLRHQDYYLEPAVPLKQSMLQNFRSFRK